MFKLNAYDQEPGVKIGTLFRKQMEESSPNPTDNKFEMEP